MYRQSEFDAAFLAERSAQFRAQVARRLSGALTEEEFKPLRLMNGVYLQLHAYMLRVAIPYGTLSADQMRRLADLAERWDRGYGHFTTRQNIQFNWPRLDDIPDMLDALAEVGLHAIQTSGNTVRNVTADPFAGAAAEEIADPRPWAELLRQWSTDHPEFQFLPRKFKIAVTGSPADRALTRAHDIGLRLVQRDGATGFVVIVGGGLGRTPMIGQVLREFLPAEDLLPYVEAVLHVYNRLGRRDNKYKARIKITLHEMGLPALRHAVETAFRRTRAEFDGTDQAVLAGIAAGFAPPDLPPRPLPNLAEGRLARWAATNTHPHKRQDYAVVTVSLKPPGGVPGDATAAQMRALADLAERFGTGELRVTQSQNIVLPHVARADLEALHAALIPLGLGTANIGQASDITACPGLDYCALATARSIPVAQDLSRRIDALGIEQDLGPIDIRISGCINACAHHHLGTIGILGLDRAGAETYQITLGGDTGAAMALGQRTGPGLSAGDLVPGIERLLRRYLALRQDSEETLAAALRRLGHGPFQAALHAHEVNDAA